MPTTRGNNFMHDLEIRIKSRKPVTDGMSTSQRASDRVADLDAGYPKKGMRTGTVDLGTDSARASSQGSLITQNPVAGVDAGSTLDDFFAAISNALGRQGATMPHSELSIPRAPVARRKGR